MSAKGRYLKRDDVALHVIDEGEGPVVLLLHGFPDSVELWRNQMPFLVAAGYRVVAFDMRGFGGSDAPQSEESYSLAYTIDDIKSILEQLEIREPVTVVGHDWGALVGWILAMEHPSYVERFVALSVGHPLAYKTAGVKQKLLAWYILAFQLRGVAERVFSARNWALFRMLTAGHPELHRWIADLERPGRFTSALNWYRANAKALLSKRFSHVKIPVMGVWSSNDVALTEAQMTISALFVDAPWRYERIEGVSHWIPLDGAQRLNALLLDFFTEDLGTTRMPRAAEGGDRR